MNLPKDWDKPNNENGILVSKFDYMTYNYKTIRMPVRYFCPNSDSNYPLVIYLHGADCMGTDNEIHLTMHDIGTMFARDNWQAKNPCYILAPQFSHGISTNNDLLDEAIINLIRDFSSTNNIDTSRIYVYGYSAGAVRTLRLLKKYSSTFAAAISICGATDSRNIDKLCKIPLWLVHAKDDRIVKASYKDERIRNLSHLGSTDLYELIADRAPNLHYTFLADGEMNDRYHVNPHCSCVVVSGKDGDEIKQWLFDQFSV